MDFLFNRLPTQHTQATLNVNCELLQNLNTIFEQLVVNKNKNI